MATLGCIQAKMGRTTYIRQTVFANICLSPVSQIYLAVACIAKIFILHNRVFDLLLLNARNGSFYVGGCMLVTLV